MPVWQEGLKQGNWLSKTGCRGRGGVVRRRYPCGSGLQCRRAPAQPCAAAAPPTRFQVVLPTAAAAAGPPLPRHQPHDCPRDHVLRKELQRRQQEGRCKGAGAEERFQRAWRAGKEEPAGQRSSPGAHSPGKGPMPKKPPRFLATSHLFQSVSPVPSKYLRGRAGRRGGWPRSAAAAPPPCGAALPANAPSTRHPRAGACSGGAAHQRAMSPRFRAAARTTALRLQLCRAVDHRSALLLPPLLLVVACSSSMGCSSTSPSGFSCCSVIGASPAACARSSYRALAMCRCFREQRAGSGRQLLKVFAAPACLRTAGERRALQVEFTQSNVNTPSSVVLPRAAPCCGSHARGPGAA